MSDGPIEVTFEDGFASRPHVELVVHTLRTLRFATMDDATAHAERLVGAPVDWTSMVNPGGRVLVCSGHVDAGGVVAVFTAEARD